MTKLKGNKPLGRDYFKYKDRPKKKDEKDITTCCNQDIDANIINVNNENDWKLVENHIEEHLRMYSGVDTVTPNFCEDCGRLIEYVCVLKRDKKYYR